MIFGDRATAISAYYSGSLSGMVLTVRRDDERRYNLVLGDDGTITSIVQDR